MSDSPRVLVVDLDGTLIHTDLLVESALQACKQKFTDAFALIGWLRKGKAELKRQLAERAEIDMATLPWNVPLLDWLREQSAAGRYLVLATASDMRYAEQVKNHLGFIDEVLATRDGHNLSAENKRLALVERYGEGGFDYAGNAADDLAVWRSANHAIIVNAPAGLQERIRVPVAKVFPAQGARLMAWSKALRLHQWLKNVLLFVPLLSAHRFDAQSWLPALFGFVAFGLCASSVYLLNDLLDLPSDRQHPRKKRRPFAAGRIPALQGILLAPCLLVAALLLAFVLAPQFAYVMLGYYCLTLAYSFSFKRIAILDVMILSGLYIIRIVAGAVLVQISLSFWLLSFALFFFVSLAFLKRYIELVHLMERRGESAKGRGYTVGDASMIASQGSAAGYTSVMVLAFYINSKEVMALYSEPQWLWGICVLLLYWLNRSWLLAHRGDLHDDPVVYAVMDRGSRVILLMVFGLLAVASTSF